MEPRSLPGWLGYGFTRVLFPGEPDPDARVRPVSLLALLLLPAAILYPTLDFHLLEPDEGRYAQIPREMLANGSAVVPTLQGEPYLDKPPLLYWLVAGSYRLFGVSAGAARLVPALCVHLTILAVYLIGRRSVGERAAMWAAMLLSVAPGYVSVARLLLLDGLLTLCVTVSVLCGFEAVRTGVFRQGWWLAAAVASGLGFLTKGPIAEVLLFVPLWTFAALAGADRRGPARVPLTWYGAFAVVVLGVNLPWYLAVSHEQPDFLSYFFWRHNVLRFLQPFDHLQPVWYYLPILAGGLMPATVLMVPYLRTLWRGGTDGRPSPSPAGGFWLLAGLWCVLFFSCSGSKLPTYILPAYPFLCLAVGEYVARSRWDWAVTTRLLTATLAILVLLVHHFGLPWYARERSPFGRPEVVARFLTDPSVPVVCFPRNCDSLAFYTGRADLRSVRTKDVNHLFVRCHHAPRTVILFTHRESFEGFRRTMPPSLGIVEHVSLRRTYSRRLLDVLFGITPWGLCDILVVEPKYQVPPSE